MRYVLLIAASLVIQQHTALAQSRPSSDSIRRLAGGAFPTLPAAIQRDLASRECLIPQPWDASTPQNVIRGAFTAPRVSEWAILCSVRATSQILIYRADTGGGAHVVDSLQQTSDIASMQGVGNGRWGYSRLIRTRPRRRILGWRVDADRNPIPRPIDHDAIDDVFLEKATQSFYCVAGRWYRQITAD